MMDAPTANPGEEIMALLMKLKEMMGGDKGAGPPFNAVQRVQHPEGVGAHPLTMTADQLFDAGEIPGIPGSRRRVSAIDIADNRTPADATATPQPKDAVPGDVGAMLAKLKGARGGR